MAISLPLEKMTVSEKLRALEDIWDDLQRNADAVPSPAWHEDVLRAREKRIRAKKARFTDWAEARARIRERAK